jgi:prevent-host-death family protein
MKPVTQVNVHQAKTELSRLLLDVERGHDVVIARNGVPVARLVPFTPTRPKGLCVDTWKRRIQMAADFDAPLTAAELRAPSCSPASA